MGENIDSGFLVDTEIDEGFSVDPYMVIYQVFALLDDNKCITSIESTAFHNKDELLEQGYVQIDDGANGKIYGHAQNNYLKMKYGKTMYDEQMRCNYKYIDKVIELTDDEKETLFPPVEPQPSELEQLKKRQEITEQALQDLILMTLGGE